MKFQRLEDSGQWIEEQRKSADCQLQKARCVPLDSLLIPIVFQGIGIYRQEYREPGMDHFTLHFICEETEPQVGE